MERAEQDVGGKFGVRVVAVLRAECADVGVPVPVDGVGVVAWPAGLPLGGQDVVECGEQADGAGDEPLPGHRPRGPRSPPPSSASPSWSPSVAPTG